jgi:MATE family multidrug resistance protein
MVGRLGAAALGAVGLAGIWIWTLLVPLVGMASGVQTFVSRHHGAEQHERCGPWVWQALAIVVPAMALWVLAIAALLPPLLSWMSPSPAFHDAALAYGYARLPGGPSVAANMVLTSFFRGLGDTRTPLRAALAGIAVNVPVAYAFIFGELGMPALGPAGAGIAVCAGSWTMCGMLFVSLLRREIRERYRTRPCRPEPDEVRRFVRTSAPIGGQWLLDMVTFAIFSSIVARMGEASMAASQAMLQLLSLSFMQAIAISIAAGALVGRYIGAGDLEAASRSFRSAQVLGLLVAAVVAVVFVAMPETLIGIFSSDPRVLELARPLLALGAFFQVVDAVGIIAAGALRGAGDTRWPFAVQATMAWLVRLPAVYVAAVVLELGVFGAWAGELVHLLLLTAAFVLRFRAGAWRTMRI